MKTWYIVKFDTRLSPSATLELCNLFFENFFTLTTGYGVFSTSDIDTETVTVYFSPETQILAKSFSFETIPCTKPSFNGLGLVLGDENSWKHFCEI
jgi:hypothetical protein